MSRWSEQHGRFLLLPENRLALAAITQLVDRHPEVMHPLVMLFGPSGTGKSHLAHHLLREAERHHLTDRPCRITAAEFAADVGRASASKTLPELQESYRRLGLLVCEDLQGIEHRAEIQLQLLAVVDELLQVGGRVLLTANRAPGQLKRFSARLVNRCHGGLCVSIEAPGLDSRKKLLRDFAASQQVPLPEAVIPQLADELPVSPRELRGVIVQLDKFAAQRRTAIDEQIGSQFLKEWQAPRGSLLKQITSTVARTFNVKPQQLRSRGRTQGLVLARQVAMFVARTLASQPCTRVGDYFGKRSHSTVIHACRRIEERAHDDPALRQLIEQIQEELWQTVPACR